jgi:hypothetical protein
MRAVWDIAPWNLVAVDRRFRGAYCLHQQGETSVYSNETTWRYIREGFYLHDFIWFRSGTGGICERGHESVGSITQWTIC